MVHNMKFESEVLTCHSYATLLPEQLRRLAWCYAPSAYRA